MCISRNVVMNEIKHIHDQSQFKRKHISVFNAGTFVVPLKHTTKYVYVYKMSLIYCANQYFFFVQKFNNNIIAGNVFCLLSPLIHIITKSNFVALNKQR